MTSPATVRPGQIWADNDPRSRGRTLRVVSVGPDKVRCVVLTASEANATSATDPVGKTTQISRSRFRPTSNGYRLVADVEA